MSDALGIEDFVGENVMAVENTDDVHNVVACTLCSCYPWAILGLPPSWYKPRAYLARTVREPRAALSAFGLELGDGVEVRVWDSSSDMRYFVRPKRPASSEGLGEEELAGLLTGDSMTEIGLLSDPAS